jgi:hypothetical protein
MQQYKGETGDHHGQGGLETKQEKRSRSEMKAALLLTKMSQGCPPVDLISWVLLKRKSGSKPF